MQILYYQWLVAL